MTNGTERNQILLLIFADTLFGFAIGLSSPLVAPLIVALGVSITFVGQAQTVGGIGATILRLPVGTLMDRIGRKQFIVMGGLITFAGFVSYSLAKFWLLLGAGIVFIALDSIIRGTASSAALGDTSKAGSVGRIFSIDFGVTQTALAISPLLGGYAATTWKANSSVIFEASAGLTIVTLLIVMVGYRPEPTIREHDDLTSVWKLPHASRQLWSLLLVVAVDSFAWRISWPFWTLYVFKEMAASPEQLGITIGIYSAIPALTGLTLGSKLDRIGRAPFLAASEWCAVGAFLPLLFGWRPEFAYLSAIFWGFVNGFWAPALNAHIIDLYGPQKFGQISGTLGLVAGIASIASPVLGGWLWDNMSPQVPFILTLFFAIANGFIIWFKLESATNCTIASSGRDR